MCHKGKYSSGKTVRFKSDDSKHANAVPYNRAKSKKDFREYDD